MPITIGSNIAALRAERRLNEGSETLSRVYERLSSGQRINRASDDAAGLAIATSLQTDARVFSQGMRNVSDAISLLGIADGALQQLSSLTTRQLELAEQSANGSYSSAQRTSLDREAQALAQEYDRILTTTKFNGIKVFNPLSQVNIQAGYGSGGILSIQLGREVTTVIGDGTFSNGVSYADLSNSSLAIINDFSGDGMADVVALANGGLSILVGNGNGTFKAVQAIQSIGGIVYANAADLNGDGAIDIVAADRTRDAIKVYLNNGNGSFASPASYASSDGPQQVEIGDINGDGVNDVVASHKYVGEITVLIGNANGTFQTTSTISIPALSSTSAVLLDINEDGILDLTYTMTSAYGISLGNGNGTFKAIASYGTALTPGAFSLIDSNGDGVKDLIEKGAIYLGNGNGTFKSQTVLATANPNNGVFFDVNGDGAIDIAVTDTPSNSLRVLLGNGNGTFKSAVSYGSGVSPRGLAFGDINGDGVSDIVTANYTSADISAFIANTTYTTAEASFSLRSQAMRAPPLLRCKVLCRR